MNHPAPETWMSYLYGELTPTGHTDAEAHLRVCPQCKASVERWRATMAGLDEDKASLVLARRRGGGSAWQPVVRWALAASVVLAAGFLAGRAAGPSHADLQRELAAVKLQVQGELQTQVQQDLQTVADTAAAMTTRENRQLLTEFARELQTARTTDRRELMELLDALDSRRALDTEALRGSLYDLARKTGNGFQLNEAQLNLLASYIPVSTASESLNSVPPENKP